MLSNDLFQNVLIDPAVKKECNKLLIVSGYATAAMAFHHIEVLKNKGVEICIELIIGMTVQDGLSKSNHRGFQQIEDDYQDSFSCSYCVNPPPIHSKVYVWLKNGLPIIGFTGSANYTQTAFSNQRETIVQCSPEEAKQYFDSIIDDTIYCTHPEAENFVTIYNDNAHKRLRRQKKLFEDKNVPEEFAVQGLPHIRLSLLKRDGDIPSKSGLNWGQRDKREHNQAYIAIPAEVYKTMFFPERKKEFTVYTDDDKVLICTIAQDNGKAIETSHNNSILGKYFRKRLGVDPGKFVQKKDLSNYGRTHVDFYKIDNETYYMDFSI